MLSPSVLAPACNPSTQEVEANEQILAQIGPHSETLFQAKKPLKVYSLMINELKNKK